MTNLGRHKVHARVTDAVGATAERAKPCCSVRGEVHEQIAAAERRVKDLESMNRHSHGMFRQELADAQHALAALKFTMDSARPADAVPLRRAPATLAHR